MDKRKRKRREEEENNEKDFLQPEPPRQKRERQEILQRIFRVIVATLGAALGPGLVILVRSIILAVNPAAIAWITLNPVAETILFIVAALIFAFLFYFMAPAIIRGILYVVRLTEGWLNSIPMIDIVLGCCGLIVGLVIAFLFSGLVSEFPLPQGLIAVISTLLYVLFAILGTTIATSRRAELRSMEWPRRKDKREDGGDDKDRDRARPKVLDTSVIIDGRIFDICQTGVIEGRLVIPGFVLVELRHVSDSADSLKRVRGRRGLDILHKIQNELDILVEIDETDYEDIAEVDAKLLRLAEEIDGTVLTNDFNLNKVASVQGVTVLNINDLANAIKPVVLPGEEMQVHIVKEGKESGQGVAYLDDGTMIVVEGGRRHMDKTLNVTVTSVLQTSAGRMIFAKM